MTTIIPDTGTPGNSPASEPLQSLPVYGARALSVISGANLGDELTDASELILDDIYALGMGQPMQRLAIARSSGNCDFIVADGSDTGTPGAALHLDSILTFMTPSGDTLDATVIVEVAATDQTIAAIYLLPITEMSTKTDYRLVGVETENTHAMFAETACVSFTRGTRIAMADGFQRPIEDIAAGDRVLTRDSGPQIVRWIGQSTRRAIGEFAPIVITERALHNENDLVVSPNHRLFIYQREDRIGAGRPEVLVKARHLVNGDTVFQREGGFVEYFQLLFDSHQIVFAEGIAAESLLLDTRTAPAFPKEISESLAPGEKDPGPALHPSYEVGETDLTGRDAAALLRRSTTR